MRKSLKGQAAYLQKTNGHADSYSSTPEGAFIVRNRPRVPGEGLQDTGELELALLNGHEETPGTIVLRSHRLAGTRGGPVLRTEA